MSNPTNSSKKKFSFRMAKLSPKAKILTKNGKIKKNSRKRLVRYGLVLGNLLVLVAVFALISTSSKKNTTNYTAFSTADESLISSPLDSVTATEIAANIALMTRAPEAEAIISDSNIVWAKLNSASINDQSGAITPSQVLSSKIKSKEDIKTHIVTDGDSLASLATKYGVTSDSIRFSNSLVSSYLVVGSRLYIPPINGVVHKVVAGDTPDSLATKYSANKSDIIAFNDAEITGLKVGELIVVPNGRVAQQTTYVARSSLSYRSYFSANYTFLARYTNYSNPYSYSRGWCTDWASYRAAQLGNPVGQWGNANTWDSRAAAAGYYVGPVPRVGAIVQTDYGWAGHVGVVEAVSADGTMIKFSDMNGLAGWGNAAITNEWVPAAGYDFIYR